MNKDEKIKKLQERIAYLERSNNRREGTILEQRQEINDWEEKWSIMEETIKRTVTKLKKKPYYKRDGYDHGYLASASDFLTFLQMLDLFEDE